LAAERKKEYACGCRPRGLFPVRCQTPQRLRREVDKAYYAALVGGNWDAYASARTKYHAHYGDEPPLTIRKGGGDEPWRRPGGFGGHRAYARHLLSAAGAVWPLEAA
jgi:hypothetical protein